MRRIALCTVAMAALSGCAIQHPVVMSGLRQPVPGYVVDDSKPDDYPGYAVAEGDIYSCRYGIHYQTPAEFNPPRAQMFADVLAAALPAITTHHVVLKRFDVYFNQRLGMLHVAGGLIGGLVGYSIAQAGEVNKNVFTFKKILLVSDPLQLKHDPKEHQVGCDNEHEGEYYSSEISGGNDVVVTWLSFDVDNVPYQFESYYQFQPESQPKIAAGISEAIQMTIEGAASKVDLGGAAPVAAARGP